MLDDGENLSRLAIRGTPLPQCQHRAVARGLRLYYRPHDGEGIGFDFYAVRWVANWAGEGQWDDPVVECIVHGTAYYDGLRHLYMGDEKTGNENYLYYPDAAALEQLFAALRDLENEHCRDA